MDSENEEEREVLNLTQTISAIDQQQIEMRNKIKQLKQELKDSEQNKKSMVQRISILGKKDSNGNGNSNQNAPNSLDHILSKGLRTFNIQSFRPMQKEIISEFLSGLDCFVIMGSGGGKSLCYQLPATVLEGITLVICPLIALMNDQVDQLKNIISSVVLIFRNSIDFRICLIYRSRIRSWFR